ncbi:MAG: carbonic anhydrase [Microbacteriaceae bacterium]|nr:carbonic anhydrase [Microbacteriaceae bacterium]
MNSRPTPAAAWEDLAAGNARFLSGEPAHPRQDADRRAELATTQGPKATFFGCSDSRLAAEIIFDQGIGDLFVVRNAGQVVSPSAVASLEYAVAVLGVPLVVVLAHDGCGAVRAAVDGAGPDGSALPPLIAAHVAPIRPAVEAARAANPDGPVDPEAVGRLHLERTVTGLLEASELLSAAVADGNLAIVGAQYRLAEGRVERHVAIGAL